MSEEEEAVVRVHPLRQASVFILAPLILYDTFLLVFTTVLLATSLGASPFTASLISSTSPFVNMIFDNFWGWMADKYGRRRPLILGGIFTVPALAGFAFATEPWHLVVFAAIRGLGGSAGVPISKALAADLAPRRVLGERMGAWTMSLYIAPVTGFTVAGILWDINPSFPFFAAAITELTAVFLAIFAIPETVVKRKLHRQGMGAKEGKGGAGGFFSILGRRGVALGAFSIAMGYLGSTAASTIAFPLFGTALGLSGIQISLVYTLGLVIGVVAVAPGGALSDRVGRKWPVVLGGIWSSLTWLLYLFVGGMATPFLGFVLISMASNLGSAIYDPAMTAYTFEWVRKEERGRASGLTEFCRDAGTVIGLPLVGFIYEVLSPESAFLFAAAVGIFTYLVIWALWKEAPRARPTTRRIGKMKMRRSSVIVMVAGIAFAVIIIVWQLIPLLLQPPLEVTWTQEATEYWDNNIGRMYRHVNIPGDVIVEATAEARSTVEQLANQTDYIVHVIDVRAGLALVWWKQSQSGEQYPGRYSWNEELKEQALAKQTAYERLREVEGQVGVEVLVDWSFEALEYYYNPGDLYFGTPDQPDCMIEVLRREAGNDTEEFRAMFGNVTVKAEELAASDGVVDLADLKDAMAEILVQFGKYDTVTAAQDGIQAREVEAGCAP